MCGALSKNIPDVQGHSKPGSNCGAQGQDTFYVCTKLLQALH